MPEQFFDVTDRTTVSQKHGCCCVAKNVRGNGRGETRQLFCSSKHRSNGVGGQSGVACGDEPGDISILAQRPILREPFQRALCEEYDPWLVSLSDHLCLALFEIHVIAVKA